MEPNRDALHASDARLYNASIQGDVDTLNQLIRDDPLLLARITPAFIRENPLHIAAMNGHSSYAEELLRHRPPLAEEVDAWGHTALHLASAKGYVDFVKVLLQLAGCRTCLRRNCEGRLPLHLAIMKRQVEVVRELVRAHPEAAREEVDGGNAAHLCVRSNYLEGLVAIVEELDHDQQFLASVDGDGNTILHLAAAFKHLKMVEYIMPLMAGGEMGKLENKREQPALDIAENSMARDLEVANCVINAGILRALMTGKETGNTIRMLISSGIKKHMGIWTLYDKKWVETMTGWLIIVAILAATVAFQAVLQPPGGVYPPSESMINQKNAYQPHAGSAVTPNRYFFIFNTYAFLSSLSLIMLLLSGAPLHNKYCVWVLMVLMWATLTSITLAYAVAVNVVFPPPPPRTYTVSNGTAFISYVSYSNYSGGLQVIPTWFVVLGLILLYHLFVILVRVAILLRRFIIYFRKP